MSEFIGQGACTVNACDNPSPTSLDESQRIALYTNILTSPILTEAERNMSVKEFRLHLCIKIYSPRMPFIASDRVKISSLTEDQIQKSEVWCSTRTWP